MSEGRAEIQNLLVDLESALREIELWHSRPPAADAFASEMPFFIDRMNFSEWLQFVFIPHIHEILRVAEPLPETSNIAPMAQVYFLQIGKEASGVLDLLARLDELIGGNRDF